MLILKIALLSWIFASSTLAAANENCRLPTLDEVWENQQRIHHSEHCDYYSCLNEMSEHKFEAALVRVGRPYCQRFTTWTHPRLSLRGQDWITRTTHCLLEVTDREIRDHWQRMDMDDFANWAAASHVECYITNGFCELSLPDILTVLMTVNPQDFLGPPFLFPTIKGVQQVVHMCTIFKQ